MHNFTLLCRISINKTKKVRKSGEGEARTSSVDWQRDKEIKRFCILLETEMICDDVSDGLSVSGRARPTAVDVFSDARQLVCHSVSYVRPITQS